MYKIRTAGFGCVLDAVWQTRNQQCFQDAVIHIGVVGKQIAQTLITLIRIYCKSIYNRLVNGFIDKLMMI